MTTPGYPDTGAPEHPAFTEAFERMLSEAYGWLPPLEYARKHLSDLEASRDAILIRAEEDGSDGELDWSREWRTLLKDIAKAAAEVARLEREAIQKPTEV